MSRSSSSEASISLLRLASASICSWTAGFSASVDLASLSLSSEATFENARDGSGMNGDGGIAEHGFGTSRRDHHVSWLARFGGNHWVHEVPEVALSGFVFNFVIADGGV